MKVKLFFATLVVLLLTACGTTDPVIRYKDIAGLPPQSLLQDCEVSAPPNKQQYLAGNWSERERLLTDSNIAQTKNIASCNEDKAALRQWRAKKEQLIREQENKQ